jgi:hypothetical protein
MNVSEETTASIFRVEEQAQYEYETSVNIYHTIRPYVPEVSKHSSILIVP